MKNDRITFTLPQESADYIRKLAVHNQLSVSETVKRLLPAVLWERTTGQKVPPGSNGSS